MYKLLTLPKFCLYVLLISAIQSQADDIIWQADFSDGDLSGWTGLIIADGLSVQRECSYRGPWAGQVTLNGEEAFIWRGRSDLNRSEFKYRPSAELTKAGEDTYFGWSFYLPEVLTESRHETGYWESQDSWQQMFRFNIVGTDFSFQSTRAEKPFWNRPNFATAGRWRDLAMHIHWSTDPEVGFAEVWLDGHTQGREYMQTLANEEDAMFVQIGILRDQQEPVERILIDNVRHGRSMEAVLARFDPELPRTCEQLPKLKISAAE